MARCRVTVEPRPTPGSLTCRVKRALRGEHGVTTFEYALIAALIVVVIAAAVKTVGIETRRPYRSIAAQLGH